MVQKILAAIPVAFMLATAAPLQAAEPTPSEVLRQLIDSYESAFLTQSEQNLMMMDDSPAQWLIEEGEALFKKPRGPKNVSLEGCDFGKGAGVIKGAYVELPRYFADSGKVMDIQTRLIYCMKELQGFTDADPAVKKIHGSDSDQMKLQTYIAAQSNGMKWNPPMNHPLEKALRDAGEVMFYRRSGLMDFSCDTCHGQTSKRIRASVLSNNAIPQEWTKSISWPTFRVSQQHVRSSQHRLMECVWQMRQAPIVEGSDASIALITFWTDAARGQPAILPDMKR